MTETIEEEAPFGDDSPGKDELLRLAERASATVYQSIQNASNQTARSQQQQDHFIGISNLGHCREYARLMLLQTPFSDERNKNAAFIGTVLGDRIEDQLVTDRPDLFAKQVKIVLKLPSGGEIPGTADLVVTPAADDDDFVQGVWDLKSKDQLETIKKMGMSDQQRFQLISYCVGAIDKGLLDPSRPIFLADVFYDRSGSATENYTEGFWYDPDSIHEIDEWVNDVKYAVMNNERASRDKPREWCWNWCDYATVCRGNDTDAEGLIEDPEALAAVDLMTEASLLTKEAKLKSESAKKALVGIEGSTGTHTVRWVTVNPTTIESYVRAGYVKLDVRPIRAATKKKVK